MPEEVLTATDTLLDYLTRPDVSIVGRLAKNAIPEDADALQLADLVEADFAGYTPATEFDWAGVGEEDPMIGHVLSAEIHFVCGPIAEPQLCTAFYLTLREGNNAPVLFQAEVFDVPFAFDAPGQTFKRQVRIMAAGQ